MWAIGATLQAVQRGPSRQDLHIACDSAITVDLLNGQARATTNQRIVHAVRGLLMQMRRHRSIHIFWVAGHAGIDGNDHADTLAGLGTDRSRAGKGADDAAKAAEEGCFISNSFTAINTFNNDSA
jgi:ribonuclease HI